jgi:hypothetical protein
MYVNEVLPCPTVSDRRQLHAANVSDTGQIAWVIPQLNKGTYQRVAIFKEAYVNGVNYRVQGAPRNLLFRQRKPSLMKIDRKRRRVVDCRSCKPIEIIRTPVSEMKRERRPASEIETVFIRDASQLPKQRILLRP